MAKAIQTDGREKIYRTWHPSPEGYALIAREIAGELKRRHILADSP
jgi:lysophospholipase L1-like esterase